jgi:hypothetical protein
MSCPQTSVEADVGLDIMEKPSSLEGCRRSIGPWEYKRTNQLVPINHIKACSAEITETFFGLIGGGRG